MKHFSRSVGSSRGQSLQSTVNVWDQIAYRDVYVTRSQIQRIVCLYLHIRAQTDTTFLRNISQHCWALQVAHVWPPCCSMLDDVRSSLKMAKFFSQHFWVLHDFVPFGIACEQALFGDASLVAARERPRNSEPLSGRVQRAREQRKTSLPPLAVTRGFATRVLPPKRACLQATFGSMRASSICFFKAPSNMLQHIATGWPNACNMLCITIWRYVVLKCLVLLASSFNNMTQQRCDMLL